MTDTKTTNLPDHPDGIEDGTRDLPDPALAAERVNEYIGANGDGMYDCLDGHPLYARDLYALTKTADLVSKQAAEIERLRAQLDEPCGFCHPCANWADETWRAADRKPPGVAEWDETRAEVTRLLDLVDERDAELNKIRADLETQTTAAFLNQAEANALRENGSESVVYDTDGNEWIPEGDVWMHCSPGGVRMPWPELVETFGPITTTPPGGAS